jgi:Acetyltransferase (GNAT) domain
MPLAHNRPATEADLPAAIDLFLAAVASMFARQHIAKPLPPRAGVELILPHILRTGLFHVAEQDGRIVAICHALVRDRLWFLSGFWTRPELVGGGVGGPLLRDVWQAGARAGAEVFFVWSLPDETALASYLKLGMLPGYPVLTFAAHDVAQDAFAHEAYAVEPLRLDVACAVDEEVRATRREVDHRFMLALPRVVARQVIRAGRTVGYFYVNGETVGPCAWLAPEHADGVLAHACRAAAANAGAITLRVPGINHDAIRFALARGLRFSGAHAHLLTTAPFGRLGQYLPSGPSLY